MSLLIACLPLGLATAPRAPPSPLAMATMAPPLARVAMSASAVNLDAAAVDAAAAAAVLPPTPKTNAVSRKVFGITFALLTALVVTGIYPLVISATIYSKLFDNERRRANDYVVQWWARTTLTLFGAKVALEGQENLPPPGEAVMFVPNHCSFLDIFSLSGFLPRRFKYISKIEILRIPLVGWAMGFAKHIALARTDRKSQLKTLKEAVETLKAGNSLVTFPEGTRSKDGVLGSFKKGPFTMAARAGVRIVPISVVGTHVFGTGALPIAIPRGVRIIVHPPLDAPVAKQEDESMAAARAAVLSGLPAAMRPAEA